MATKKNWEENRPRSREKTITGDKSKQAKVEIGTDERKNLDFQKRDRIQLEKVQQK